MIQWLQGALRRNLIQTTHYLTGLEGCGIKAETGIQQQFFKIIDRIVHVLKHEDLKKAEEYVHLMNALCWNYTLEDHKHLMRYQVFETLQRGDGTIMHPIYRSWGQEDSNFVIRLNKENELNMASRLRQVFEFLVQTVLSGIFVTETQEKIEEDGDA